MQNKRIFARFFCIFDVFMHSKIAVFHVFVNDWRKIWRNIGIALLKLVVFPFLIVGILLGIKSIFTNGIVDFDLIMGVFMAFAVPTAGLASTFSNQCDGDTEGAVAFTLGTTILSVITIPLIYWLLCIII